MRNRKQSSEAGRSPARGFLGLRLAAWRPRGRLAVFLVALGFCSAFPAGGQVVINEVVAANSDRQLQRSGSLYPRVGTSAQWWEGAYDDSLWKTGNGPFGFGSFSGVTLGVNLSSTMQNKLTALYVRKAFNVTAGQAASTNQLQLVTRFNDGFIAFVNGVEVARRNMGNPGMYAYRDQTAFNTNLPPCPAITLDLGAASNRLWAGTNTLCIQTHNQLVTSTDFLSMADLRIGGAAATSLVTNNTSWRYFAGMAEPSGGLIDYGIVAGVPETATWAALAFDDSSWPESAGPFGFDLSAPQHYVPGTDLNTQMVGTAASVYTRTVFPATADEASSTNALRLVIDYDDGIIIYLNGREVARRNVGVTNTITAYNAVAGTNHNANGEGGATNRAETIVLAAASKLLAGGDNILGVQAHNSALTNADLIARVTLSTTGASARTLVRPEDVARYFVGTSEPKAIVAGEEEGDGSVDYEQDTPDSESDWIELYNGGAAAVNLTGWSLSDDSGKPRKWYFPAGSSIPARGYLVVMATGFDVGPANGATYVHTNFKLSSGGEYLGLVDAAGTVVSEIAPSFPPQSYFHSYVRQADGSFAFSDKSTPGAANAGSLFSAITAPPDFSNLGGFCAAPLLLQLAAPDPQAAVRYTLDGREPCATNALYSTPLTLNTNTVVRARCFKAGEVPSAAVTHTYLVAQSAARQAIAAVCLAADPVLGFYGPNASGGPTNGEGILAIKGGAYTNGLWYNRGDMDAFNMPLLYGRPAEKPAGFEFYPTSGVPLRTDLGLRVSSSPYSRPRLILSDKPTARFTYNNATQKPSFNIFFRGELGESPQDYPFFPESKVTTFEDIRIRAGKNDIFNPFLIDEWVRRIFIGTGQQGAIGTFASVYLNGVWKGYFNFCEHLREAFMQQHHGSVASWDIRQVAVLCNGDSINWNSALSFLRTRDLSIATNYVGAQGYFDTDNVIDYLMVNAYCATGDWPHNNWVAGRERSDAGRWRFYMWDAEMSFGFSTGRGTNYNAFTNVLIVSGSSLANDSYAPAVCYTRLRFSPEFRLRFADRAQKHLFHGGCLTRESMEGIYLKLRDAINPIMKETAGVTVNESYYIAWIVAGARRTNFIAQLTEQGLWPATQAPEFSQHGGTLAPNTAVGITNPNAAGSIYFTTNGVDPRAPGGAVAGTLYAAPIRFPVSATLKARVLGPGGEWSPLQEVFFLVPSDFAVFLPSGSADWTADANWSSSPSPYPSGTNVTVFLNAPATADREVSLRAPVRVGSVTVVQNETPYRNKIRDRSTGNTLSFQATNRPAELVVNGTGAGYVELEVGADTVLDSDLRVEVNNTADSADYGALRLRAIWRGAGGLIKEGDGVVTLTGDGKNYTGATVVRRGVLALTQPAAPLQSPSLTVAAGGQLRLTSPSTVGAPRLYAFGSPLTLSSLGREGELPADGQGVAGGLRYQPDSDDSVAVITNGIAFAGLSGVHVEGARNTLELAGLLSGPAGFVKTGGGNLALSAQNLRYLAPITVSNGTLTVTGRVASAVTLAPGGVLSGTGRAGPLFGPGTVALDRQVFTAPFAQGVSYAVSFAVSGSPSYATPAASGNGVLRVLTVRPGEAPPVINVYLDVPELVQGSVLRGGIFEESGQGLPALLDAATVRFFVPDLNGLNVFSGRTYSLYAGGLPLTVTAMPETADFGSGPQSGRVMEIRVAGSPVGYTEWMQSNYPLYEAQSDPAVSGPEADPFGFGIPNLLKYAFGVRPGEYVSDRMPVFSIQDGVPVYAFRFDPGKNDLAYRVEASTNLQEWGRVLFDSRTDRPDTWDGDTLQLADPASGPALSPRQFYRLRVLLTDP